MISKMSYTSTDNESLLLSSSVLEVKYLKVLCDMIRVGLHSLQIKFKRKIFKVRLSHRQGVSIAFAHQVMYLLLSLYFPIRLLLEVEGK